ncbi:caprin-1a [Gouania willdenowi]|uniref:caprin-1a n=1 Tax=Gouania willdenowi TaxID=441366 RepID=UPI001056959D|nr:caprin-1-like [Gouania willdenowi]XP_028299049.1 caprin-1-like [Gouania willdenowi]
MPSATVGNSAVQSAIPDLGNGSQSELMKQILGVVEKKVRNMEKKKSKLDDYQAKKDKGERLNQDQLDALTKYQEVGNNLEFARELQKSFVALGQEVQKAVKKSARREQLQREEIEQQRLKTVLELQYLLDQLGDDSVRQDLKQPDASGSSLLSDTDLTSLDEFYKLAGPERNYDIRLTGQYEEASIHLWELLEGRDKAVAGTTYKSLKETLDKVLMSGYFDRAHTHQNGTCEKEEEQEDQPVVTESKPEEQPSAPDELLSEKYPEPIQVESTEFVNRQFVPESTAYSTDKDQVEEWTVEPQLVNSLQHQPPAQLAPEPSISVSRVSPPPPATDPVVRKQAVQDLMAQMQGTYNFMQDSVLEFDGQVLDPAIVSAQPMKPGSVDLQPMGGPLIHTESRLPQTTTVSGPQESSQVFNMNAPVPAATDGQADPLNQPSQFPSGFGQGFSNTPENPVKPPELPQERLQSVVGGYQSQDQAMPSAAVHEDPSTGAAFGQSGQAFYNSRAVPRGGPRSTRGMMNGYRGSSNGFRGGYEGYRPPFSGAPSSGYGQTQFNTSRDFSTSTYQRDGYQQGYKRGAAQGPRGLSRGNSQTMRS